MGHLKKMIYIEILHFIVMILESSNLYLIYKDSPAKELLEVIILLLLIELIKWLYKEICIFISWISQKCKDCCSKIFLGIPIFVVEFMINIGESMLSLKLIHIFNPQLTINFQNQLRLTLIAIFLILKVSLMIYFNYIFAKNLLSHSDNPSYQEAHSEKIEL